MPQFTEWESFYVIVGASAPPLAGLMFVVLTPRAPLDTPPASRRPRADGLDVRRHHPRRRSEYAAVVRRHRRVQYADGGPFLRGAHRLGDAQRALARARVGRGRAGPPRRRRNGVYDLRPVLGPAADHL